MASAETPSPTTTGSDSSFGRVFGVLFSPKPTFESIVRRPTWVLPLILIVIVSVVMIFIFGQRVGWRAFMIRQDQQNSRSIREQRQPGCEPPSGCGRRRTPRTTAPCDWC